MVKAQAHNPLQAEGLQAKWLDPKHQAKRRWSSPKPQRKAKRLNKSGVTLVELLIVMGLLGLLLIPAMLSGVSFFTTQLHRASEQVALSRNTSYALNQTMQQLGYTKRLIPSTTGDSFTPADELRYGYYDPLRQQDMVAGLRLVDSGGRRLLYRLVYEGGSWQTESPYPTAPATAFSLPSGVSFEYCTPDGCGVSPDQALYVQLDGWTFRNENNTDETWPLPTSQIYLGTHIDEARAKLSDEARLLYTVSGTQAFGASVNLRSLSLNNKRNKLLAFPSVLPVLSAAPGLTTLLTGVDYPGAVESIKLDPITGRVFFTASGRPYYWEEGLSSAVTIGGISRTGLGINSTAINEATGNIYFGAGCLTDGGGCAVSSPLYQWDAVNNTTQALTGVVTEPGYRGIAVDGERGLVYAAFYDGTAGDANRVWMYNETNDTLYTLPAVDSNLHLSMWLNPTTGNLFFGTETNLYRWTPTQTAGVYDTGTLTTIADSLTDPANSNSYFLVDEANDGIVFYDTGGLYAWKEGQSNLTTILSSAMTLNDASRPRHFDFNGDEQIVYAAASSTPSTVYAYNFSTDTLTTVGSTVDPAYSAQDSNTDWYYFPTYPHGAIRAYNSTSGSLTTVVSGSDIGFGFNGLCLSPDSNFMFVGGSSAASNRSTVTNLSSGITTVISGHSNSGHDNVACSRSENRFFFGTSSDSVLYSWSDTDGLETLLDADSHHLQRHSYLIDDDRKRLYIGNNQTSRNFYYYQFGENVAVADTSLYQAQTTGALQESKTVTLSNTVGSVVYTSLEQDAHGNLYAANATMATIDAYSFDNTEGKYLLATQLESNSSIIDSNAVLALDGNNEGAAVLTPSTRTVQWFSNKRVNGAASPASSFSVAENTSPTGLAINRKTGDYLVLDSTLTGSQQVTLRTYNNSGVYQSGQDILIDVSDDNLGAGLGATTETQFRIKLDEIKNQLYLIAPTLNRYYVFSLPSSL
jgi:type II secretory pathway pseudopilin PulG